MKAVQIVNPSEMKVVELEKPVVGAGEVLVEAASPGGGRRADGCGGCGAGRSLGVRPVSADPTALCAGIAGAVCPAGPAGGLAAVETAVGPAGGEG